MLNHSLRIGRIHGIEIAIHWSWLIIFILLTWSLAEFFFPPLYPGWAPLTYWVVGAISSLLLFVSVLIHELSHSLVAEAQGIPVDSITLFVFGGVSNIEREPPTARAEFLMAAAGPASSLIISGVAYGMIQLVGPRLPTTVQGILVALTIYNAILGIFNLIPGFPLDGGRIFRAIVWGLTGSFSEATTIATVLGQVFAYLFIFGGVLLALTGAFLSGLWLVFIGWFLNNAAVESRRQAELESLLRGVRVGQVMIPNPPVVPAGTTLSEFVERYVLARNLRAAPVVLAAGDRIIGLISLNEVRMVPRDLWDTTTVEQVMRPLSELILATPDEPLIQALRDMSRADINQIPVVSQGHLVGILTRGQVIRFLQIREELGQRAA